MTDEPDAHFTAKDHILEQIRDLRDRDNGDRDLIIAEIKGLTAYLIVAELEMLVNAVTRATDKLPPLVERFLQDEAAASSPLTTAAEQNDETHG